MVSIDCIGIALYRGVSRRNGSMNGLGISVTVLPLVVEVVGCKCSCMELQYRSHLPTCASVCNYSTGLTCRHVPLYATTVKVSPADMCTCMQLQYMSHLPTCVPLCNSSTGLFCRHVYLYATTVQVSPANICTCMQQQYRSHY